jgi:hypothetical protein
MIQGPLKNPTRLEISEVSRGYKSQKSRRPTKPLNSIQERTEALTDGIGDTEAQKKVEEQKSPSHNNTAPLKNMKDSFCDNELTMLIGLYCFRESKFHAFGNIAGNAELEQHFLAGQVSMSPSTIASGLSL